MPWKQHESPIRSRARWPFRTAGANLGLEDGIGDVTGDPSAMTIIVRSDPALISPEQIETAITKIGYRVRTKEAA